MLVLFGIIFCGVWALGGLIVLLLWREARAAGIAALIGGLLGLAICLSY